MSGDVPSGTEEFAELKNPGPFKFVEATMDAIFGPYNVRVWRRVKTVEEATAYDHTDVITVCLNGVEAKMPAAVMMSAIAKLRDVTAVQISAPEAFKGVVGYTEWP